MAYLIRTFRAPTKVGEHVVIPDSQEDNSYDMDTGVVFPQNGKPVFNDASYNAHAATGFADPLFSLFPVSTESSDKSVDAKVKELTKKYGDYYEALPNLLKRGSLKKAIEYANKVKSDIAKDYFGKYGWDDYDWGNFAVVELNKDFPLKEKNKYLRLLNNLREYGPYHRDPNEYLKDSDYDRPQHALIEAKIDDIFKSTDKIERESAQSDNPNEYRVKDYTVKGLWTPRQVDNIIKKYYPDYVPGHVGELPIDESRAKDALDEIISRDSNDILSDKYVKNIVKGMNNMLNSTFVGNIASLVNRWY